jgi:hypothetical protein
MACYRCYQLNAQSSIQRVHDIEAASDADALLRAGRAIETSADLPALEIWQGKRIVGRLMFAQPTERATAAQQEAADSP